MRSTHAAAISLCFGLLGALTGCAATNPNKDPNMVCRPASTVGTNIGHTVCTPVKKDGAGSDSTGRNPDRPRPATPPSGPR